MSLQFVMGPSGAGKSHYLYQKVTEESIQNPEKNYLVLVPEQFTMQTQKDLVLANPQKGILNVDVLSFNRLAYRVFEETGANRSTMLDDVGKSFVLRKIAGAYEKELSVLGGNLKKPGFISQIKSVISEFTQYDVQREDLERILGATEEQSAFAYKLRDIAKIYEEFSEYLKDKYITGEELLDVLCIAVPKSKLLKGSTVVLDGFTGFTPVQNKLLKELLSVCEKLIVTVTVNPQEKKSVLFDMSYRMMDALSEIAREGGVTIDAPVVLCERPVYRFREAEALDFLEANLFRYRKVQYEKAQDCIQIYSAKQPKEELVFVAQRIRNLVRTRGLRYREIAVIASDMGAYADYAEQVFAAYDIPVFLDHKRSILLNSFVEYLRSLLAMAEQNFTYESVFRYLRTGLTEFTTEEVDILENYCVALGIRGYKKWQETWIRRAKGMEEADLAYVNALRSRLVENVAEVMEVLKSRSKTVESVTRALHTFLLQNELQQKVKSCETAFGADGELALEREYAQIYRIVMELFNQFVELLGDERIPLKEYCELLDAGLEEAKVGIIPPSHDQLVMGDIERTRIKDVKVLFFVGLNDAYIPGAQSGDGLLSEQDRARFEASKVALAAGSKEKAFIQKFYLYLMMTKPSNSLVLSYSRASAEGKALRPAYLLSDLLKLYPQMCIQKMEEAELAPEFTKTSGISYLAEGLQKKDEGLSAAWQEVYSWYKKNPKWSSQVERLVAAAFCQRENELLTKETARELYGEILSNSVSRLERFSACAYAHFLRYGLRLSEREVYRFQMVDWGNLFHSAMDRYAKTLEQRGQSWTLISQEQREALIEESVDSSIVDYGNTILYSSAHNEYMITRLKRMMRRTVWALTKQLEKGDFLPEHSELVYSGNIIPLTGDAGMQLHGKIDRVDVCETEDGVLVKVIDYKTGTKVFDLGELYYGLQMQLVVYLNAALQIEGEKRPGKRIVPAGLFYYKMEDPLLPKMTNSREVQEELLLKALCPDGIVNASEEVISHLERDFERESLVIPVKKKADGSFAANTGALPQADFALISEFAEEKMRQLGDAILQGEASASPYALGQRTGCDYCPYRGICGFDEKIAGYAYRELDKKDKEAALAAMRKEADEWESDSQKNNNK
ncbi:MAG: helicase-exonuclease AddAB subunit AddB [Faecalimonas sp.]|nr:helicase-exonuclease AddAB subunit AddB [Faecalimonas sp.]